MENPVEFVTTGPGGSELIVNKKVFLLLEEEMRPITVVCVVGPYRTGKSYLLNRIMKKKDGFALGSKVTAATKGIWLWKGDFFDDPTRALILLDTEGLDDPEKGDASHDMNLFVMSLMMSSLFIYNTKGTIDAKSIDGLRYAAEMGDFIRADTEDDDPGQNLAQHLPNFIWAVRDFHLDTEIDGKKVTANGYLEHCLKTKPGVGKKIAEYNMIRDAIRNFFAERSCCVFPPPVTTPEQMRRLEELDEKDLDPNFLVQADVFLGEVQKAKTKYLNGTEMKGRSFALLAEQYATAVLKRDICIESTYDYIMKRENQLAVEDATKELKSVLGKLLGDLPVSGNKFAETCKAATAAAHKKFLSACINFEKHRKDIEPVLDGAFDQVISETRKQNDTASDEKCKMVLASLYEPIRAKAGAGNFLVRGGYKELQKANKHLQESYNRMPEDELGPQKNERMKHFITEVMTPLLNTTMKGDEKMTAADRRKEQLELQKAQMDAANKALHADNERKEKERVEMQKSHEEKMKQFREQSEKEFKARMDALNRQMENERKEAQRLAEEGRKEAAKQHQELVNTLMKDRDRQHEEMMEMMKAIADRPPPVVHVDGGGGCVIS